MAGEQDIIGLGLNIDSFDAKKKKILGEYIALFDTLSKYDGKIFNPVMGDGLTKFNTSIAETNRLINELNTRMSTLNSVVNSKSIRNFSIDTDNAHKSTKKFSDEISVTNTRLDAMGKSLTRGLGYLRNIAYILPGIGLAGIFNIAFQAIETAAEELGLFNSKELDLIKTNTEVNKSITEQIGLYKQLLELRKEFLQNIDIGGFNSLTMSAPYFNEDADSFYKQKEKADLLQARGNEPGMILQQRLDFAKLRYETLTKAILSGSKFGGTLGLNVVDIQKQANSSLEQLDKVEKAINFYSETIARKAAGYNLESGKKASQTEVKELLKEAESRKGVLTAQYGQQLTVLKDYYDAKTNVDKTQRELDKFNEDQERKLRLETAKDDISLALEKNKAILADDKKFHDDKDAAIRRSFEKEQEQNKANYDNVINNLSSTPKEIQIAENKLADENAKARIKRDKDIEKNDVEFYQRKILALTEIQKDEINLEAVTNERVYLNDQHSLKERLDAYENYIIERQKMRDLEANLAIQRGASTIGGPTSLTPDEQKRVLVHQNTEKFNIQADAEKQTYDIVKTFLDLQLKEVKDKNDEEIKINKDAYAKELTDNNERFKGKIFAYEAFKKNKEFIDKKYGVILSVEKEIEKDSDNVSRLNTLYQDLIKTKEESDKKLSEKKGRLDSSGRSLDSERSYNEELGKNNAYNDAIIKARKELDDAIQKKDDDKVKQAKARYEELIQFEKEHSENRKRIEEGIFDLASKLVNAKVEKELAAIERITQTRDEQFGLEEKAIEQSTLTSKDKAALDIQLTEQKLEMDKAAQAEERKIKHDAAIRDRELAISHVMWNGIEAVSSALKLPPPAGEILAAERGILAALELAQILAVPLPAYKYGTQNHPGGLARFAEGGNPELIDEPGKEPWIALTETVKDLPKGTKVIPLNGNHPEFGNGIQDESWEQTRYLARQIKKGQKEVVNIFKPNIIVDIGFESYKSKILGN